VVPTSRSSRAASVKQQRESRHSSAPPKDSLSSREVEVCKLLVEGLQLKQVAIRLNVSINTADCHVRNAYQKLGVHTRAELARYFASPNAPAERDSMSPPHTLLG
jgi:DNA-binding NarL/FixJ family response regulator